MRSRPNPALAEGSRCEIVYRAGVHGGIAITADERVGTGVVKYVKDDGLVAVKLDGETTTHEWPASVVWAVRQ